MALPVDLVAEEAARAFIGVRTTGILARPVIARTRTALDSAIAVLPDVQKPPLVARSIAREAKQRRLALVVGSASLA